MFFYYHCCKILFYGLFFTKIYDSSPHFLYMIKKKSKIFFTIIWVYLQWLYIFALSLLVWLMTTKIFIPIMFVGGRGGGACVLVFMRIVSMWWFLWELLVCDSFLCRLLVCHGFLCRLLVCDGFLCRLLVCDGFLYRLLVSDGSLYRWLICDGFLSILLVCDGFLCVLLLLKLFLVWKGGYVYVWRTCKNVWVLRVCFSKSKNIQVKKCPRLPYFTLLNCVSI